VALRRRTMKAPSQLFARGGRGVARRCRGWDDPQPLRRPLQAERAARLRAGAASANPPRVRRRSHVGRHARRPARPRRPSARRRPRSVDDPQHVPSAARALPTRDRARRCRGQPDERPRASGGARAARPHRLARSGGAAPRRPRGARPRAVGGRRDRAQVARQRPRRPDPVCAPPLPRHALAARSDAGHVFGRTPTHPFNPVNSLARMAWQAANLSPIGLQEASHTYASSMIAAASTRRRFDVATRRSRSRTTATGT
jgi:hypothetical protein